MITLGRLLDLSEDDIICDLAETYHIFNYREMPLLTIATLVCGLRDDSRIMLRLSENNLSIDRQINAMICDNLSYILWSKTKDAESGRNKPKSILNALKGVDDKSELMTFENGEDFKKAWENL